MSLTFKDLTIDERVPVYMNAFQSFVASALLTINPAVLKDDPESVTKVVNAAWSFLPKRETNWLYMYCDGTMLRNSYLYLESLVADSPNVQRVLVDTPHDPVCEAPVALTLNQMRPDVLEAFIMSVMLQTGVELFSIVAESEAADIDPVEEAHQLLMRVMMGFIPDPESFEEFKKVYISDEATLKLVANFIAMHSHSDETMM